MINSEDDPGTEQEVLIEELPVACKSYWMLTEDGARAFKVTSFEEE